MIHVNLNQLYNSMKVANLPYFFLDLGMAIWEFSLKNDMFLVVGNYLITFDSTITIWELLSLCPVVSTPGCTISHRC